MTSYVIADSGIFLAAVLTETLSKQATNLIAEWKADQVEILAPYLFRYEIVSVLRKRVVRGEYTYDEAVAALDGLLREPVKFITNDRILRRAFALAHELNRPATYDAVYLALAEQYECDFWTLDERFYNAILPDYSRIRWVGNIVP
jgi:predicted nucleic acid-binding protein